MFRAGDIVENRHTHDQYEVVQVRKNPVVQRTFILRSLDGGGEAMFLTMAFEQIFKLLTPEQDNNKKLREIIYREEI